MYNLVEGKETVEASVSSPFIITLSMEAIHGIAKPILKVLKSGRVCLCACVCMYIITYVGMIKYDKV